MAWLRPISVPARIAYAVLLVGFLVQGVFRIDHREPYPGLFGPNFGRPQDRYGSVRVMVPRFEVVMRDGATTRVRSEDLLYDWESSRGSAARLFFKGPVEGRRDVHAWLCLRLGRLGYADPRLFIVRQITIVADKQSSRVLDTEITRTLTFPSPCRS